MTGKWTQPGVPLKGWTCTAIQDLEDARAVCEMCEVAEIRFVHHMEHGDYGPLSVGCICAGFMEQDVERARNRERTFRKQIKRRENWLMRKWRRSISGNLFLNTDGFNIVVFPKSPPLWGSRITWRSGGEYWESKRRYTSQQAAQMGAFDGLVWLLAHPEKYNS